MENNYCPKCGEKLTEQPRFCPKCGAELDGGTSAPQYRGSRSERSFDMDPKDRMMRLIYAIVVVIIFMLIFGGYHYLKNVMGFPI